MSLGAHPHTKLGYAHYVCFPDDGRRHEIVDGDHYMNPAPGTKHQTVSKRLQHELYTRIELTGLGVFFGAPFDVQLSEHDIVQPDLLIVLNPKKSLITPAKLMGIPDLVVEILSPSNVAFDQVLKRDMYARCGVPEFWIVDPVERVLTQFVLCDGVYRSNTATSEVRLSIVEGVTVPLDGIWS